VIDIASMSEDREVLSEVWGGRVPAIFNLAEQDGAAEPCCLMLPRMSYLPLITEKVKSHFSPNAEHKGPIWFSHKKIPLRWHLPIGLLFDMLGSRHQEVTPGSRLPWSITVHLSEFPAETLLECPSREAVESIFMSSLKESDQLKTSGKVMKQMQAREHSQLWLGLCSDKFDQFWAVNRRLMEGSDCWRHLPVRVYSGDNCAMAQRLMSPSSTLSDIMEQFSLPDTSHLVIQGVRPPLSTPVLWLARHLAHPDNFVYIAVQDQENH